MHTHAHVVLARPASGRNKRTPATGNKDEDRQPRMVSRSAASYAPFRSCLQEHPAVDGYDIHVVINFDSSKVQQAGRRGRNTVGQGQKLSYPKDLGLTWS